jgi:hypothetical protein
MLINKVGENGRKWEILFIFAVLKINKQNNGIFLWKNRRKT